LLREGYGEKTCPAPARTSNLDILRGGGGTRGDVVKKTYTGWKVSKMFINIVHVETTSKHRSKSLKKDVRYNRTIGGRATNYKSVGLWGTGTGVQTRKSSTVKGIPIHKRALSEAHRTKKISVQHKAKSQGEARFKRKRQRGQPKGTRCVRLADRRHDQTQRNGGGTPARDPVYTTITGKPEKNPRNHLLDCTPSLRRGREERFLK